MGEEDDLKNSIEEAAIELGSTMEGASFLLGYEDMMELAMRAIMNELRISNDGKLSIIANAALQFK